MKNKLLAVLVSAVIAFGLWLYVITVVSPESEQTYYDIPVVLQNKDVLNERGLMIVGEVPTVTLVLKGNRTILNELNESNINVITNVANIEKPGTINMTYSLSFPGNVSYNDVSVQSSSTDLITLKVENKVKKIVPVIIDYGESAVPEGYIADKKNVELDYRSVTVVGPESVVDPIHQAMIDVDLTNQTKTIVNEYQYTLCDQEGNPVNVEMVTTNVENVILTLRIQRVKEIALVVDVIDGGGATSKTSTISIEPKTIRVSGSDTLLEDLDELVIGTINLSEMLLDETLTFPVIVPPDVTNETGVEQATVDVKFPQLMIKTFKLKEINAINVPEGLEVDMITEALEVKVRGPINLVKKMKETDLTVTVDFAGAQIGTATMSAEVTLSEEFKDVGAVGTYQVSATLQDPNEKEQ